MTGYWPYTPDDDGWDGLDYITNGPSIACRWCVQADPGLICQADLGGVCPSVDLGGGGRQSTANCEDRRVP